MAGSVGAGGGVVFVFPGQGSQWVGMGRLLWGSSSVFGEAMAECDAVLGGLVGWSLSEVLGSDDPVVLEPVDVVQPVLCAVMISLARLWESVGVTPDVVVGHSQGEVAAACVAGILTLEEALRIVVTRSRLITRLAGAGGMVWVAAPAADLEPLTADGISIAAVNGPASVVLSGETERLDKAEAWCGERGWRTRRVPVDYASHSSQVDSLEADLKDALTGLAPRSGTITFHSTVDGAVLDGTKLDETYWFRNLREQVKFSSTIETLASQGLGTFVEISPHPVLTIDIATHTENTTGATVVPTLRRDDGDWDRFLLSAA
ncbi:acyltransferase domain-containing protein, partial [Amycolatopsis minnesotensis]|uniref:acyltransferase domain-containing protein n=1 Tax=Amycolatopsis minnesotensis TaxID=337894 RepID=UPI0031D5FFC8